MDLIATATASASASIEFTDLSSAYHKYIIVFENFAPSTDNVWANIRLSKDNGSTFDSGASDYRYNIYYRRESGFVSYSDSTSDVIRMYSGDADTGNRAGNASNEFACGQINIYNPSATRWTHVDGHYSYLSSSAASGQGRFAGMRVSASAVDAIQILFSSGNIASGTFKLYGIK